MGVRLLTGTYDGTQHGVMMVDSTDNMAFGPLFEDEDEAEAFQQWFTSGEAAKAADGLGIASHGNDDDPRGYWPRDLRSLCDHWRVLAEEGLVT